MKQKERRTKIKGSYIGSVERGEKYISLADLRLVAKALGVRVRVLVEDI